jgi:uncharacterized membrane protein (UPF0127 family)
MPYTIQKQDGKFCVVKVGTSKSFGCHETRAGAAAQIGAIESNEKSTLSPVLARAINLQKYGTVRLGGVEFYVADTAEHRKDGLAGLAALDKAGMVFVYDEDVSHAFTMSAMEFDLNVAFYDEEGALITTKICKAGSGAVHAPRPYRYVVEVPTGTDALSVLDVSRMKKKKKKKGKAYAQEGVAVLHYHEELESEHNGVLVHTHVVEVLDHTHPGFGAGYVTEDHAE